MGLIIKPFTHNPSNNNTTPAESAKVNANDDTIYTLVNGNISDLNVSPTAGIQQSKIFNLNTTINDTRLRLVTSVIENPSEQAIANTPAQVAIYQDPIPGGTLTGSSAIFGQINLLLQSILNGSTVSVLLYYGGQLFLNAPIINSSGILITGLLAVKITYQIHSRNSLISQVGEGEIRITPINPALTIGGTTGIFSTVNMTALAVDSASAQNLNCNILWNVAHPSNIISSFGHYAWRPRA